MRSNVPCFFFAQPNDHVSQQDSSSEVVSIVVEPCASKLFPGFQTDSASIPKICVTQTVTVLRKTYFATVLDLQLNLMRFTFVFLSCVVSYHTRDQFVCVCVS